MSNTDLHTTSKEPPTKRTKRSGLPPPPAHLNDEAAAFWSVINRDYVLHP